MTRKDDNRVRTIEAPPPDASGKPLVQIVERGNGKIFIVGAQDAARFCGVSQQAFSRVVRTRYIQRIKPKSVWRIEDKVRRIYPELFEGSSR